MARDIVEDRVVICDGEELVYTLRRSVRARRVKITVHHDCDVSVTIPFRFTYRAAENFLIDRASWVRSVIDRQRQSAIVIRIDSFDMFKDIAYRRDLKKKLVDRISFFNSFYGLDYNRVAVKNTKRTWGSCSGKGNLNFSCRMGVIPDDLFDYVIVHELAHLRHMNHSQAFWNYVSEVLPDFVTRRYKLGKVLIESLSG